MTGSSPGCQRSMLSGEPSDEPKNRLEVLKEKPSRGGVAGFGATLSSPCGLLSSDSDMSSGGSFSAACSSGSSGARSTEGAVSAVLAPLTSAFDVAGSSIAGTRSAGPVVSGAGAGDATMRRSPFSVRSTFGKSAA